MDKSLIDLWMMFGAGFAVGGMFAFYVIWSSCRGSKE